MATSSLAGEVVLVTGGAGFIGSHLAERLATEGARVRVLDDLSTGAESNLAPLAGAVELQVGDLRDPEACRRAAAGARWVFHQAALGSVPRSMEDPATTLAVNVAGTGQLLAAAREAGVERVIYASSSSVYGDSSEMPRREGAEGRPLSPYAASKQMTEAVARSFFDCFGLAVVGLRYFNVYGPRQRPDGPYAAVVPRFFDALLAGEPPVVHGDGGQTRDFTFVDDAVAANLAALAAPARALGRSYNVATGRATSVLELARRIGETLGIDRDPVFTAARPGDARQSRADLERARRDLGLAASTPLERGLAACAAHYRERRREPAVAAPDEG